MDTPPLLHFFNDPVPKESWPERFPYPFYHNSEPIAHLAAQKVKNLIVKTTKHRFEEKGKMFGVLVVEYTPGVLGFLMGYSGKLQKNESPVGFVPPVVDVHKVGGFYKLEEKKLDALTLKIKNKKKAIEYTDLKKEFTAATSDYHDFIIQNKEKIRINKALRKKQRVLAQNKTNDQTGFFLALDDESRKEQSAYKKEKKKRAAALKIIKEKYQRLEDEIGLLISKRSIKSKSIQDAVFERACFSSYSGGSKSLLELFKSSFSGRPPAGAGECAAPRLLQTCFSLGYKPISFTEFWWGAAPKKALRIHGVHYPACRGKCEPILNHMLTGISVSPSVLEEKKGALHIPVLYNDPALLVVEKPTGLLSVPGKNIKQCVLSVLKRQLNDDSPLFAAHRLDRQTSGVLLIAKNKKVLSALQIQFEKRKVNKTYVAILDGEVPIGKGIIVLPLRADINDRPRQLVCHEHGKQAETHYEVVKSENKQTRVVFYPRTGRSHQLRVHAAFHKGLNTPILGDDLYGRHDQRMYLHAEKLIFEHPDTKEKISIVAPAPF